MHIVAEPPIRRDRGPPIRGRKVAFSLADRLIGAVQEVLLGFSNGSHDGELPGPGSPNCANLFQGDTR